MLYRNHALNAALAFCCFCVSLVDAAESRKWTSADGKYTVVGEMLSVANGSVLIRKEGQAEPISVPLGKLSRADLDYVARQNAANSMKAKSTSEPKAEPTTKAAAVAEPDPLTGPIPPGAAGLAQSGPDGRWNLNGEVVIRLPPGTESWRVANSAPAIFIAEGSKSVFPQYLSLERFGPRPLPDAKANIIDNAHESSLFTLQQNQATVQKPPARVRGNPPNRYTVNIDGQLRDGTAVRCSLLIRFEPYGVFQFRAIGEPTFVDAAMDVANRANYLKPSDIAQMRSANINSATPPGATTPPLRAATGQPGMQNNSPDELILVGPDGLWKLNDQLQIGLPPNAKEWIVKEKEPLGFVAESHDDGVLHYLRLDILRLPPLPAAIALQQAVYQGILGCQSLLVKDGASVEEPSLPPMSKLSDRFTFSVKGKLPDGTAVQCDMLLVNNPDGVFLFRAIGKPRYVAEALKVADRAIFLNAGPAVQSAVGQSAPAVMEVAPLAAAKPAGAQATVEPGPGGQWNLSSQLQIKLPPGAKEWKVKTTEPLVFMAELPQGRFPHYLSVDFRGPHEMQEVRVQLINNTNMDSIRILRESGAIVDKTPPSVDGKAPLRYSGSIDGKLQDGTMVRCSVLVRFDPQAIFLYRAIGEPKFVNAAMNTAGRANYLQSESAPKSPAPSPPQTEPSVTIKFLSADKDKSLKAFVQQIKQLLKSGDSETLVDTVFDPEDLQKILGSVSKADLIKSFNSSNKAVLQSSVDSIDWSTLEYTPAANRVTVLTGASGMLMVFVETASGWRLKN